MLEALFSQCVSVCIVLQIYCSRILTVIASQLQDAVMKLYRCVV